MVRDKLLREVAGKPAKHRVILRVDEVRELLDEVGGGLAGDAVLLNSEIARLKALAVSNAEQNTTLVGSVSDLAQRLEDSEEQVAELRALLKGSNEEAEGLGVQLETATVRIAELEMMLAAFDNDDEEGVVAEVEEVEETIDWRNTSLATAGVDAKLVKALAAANVLTVGQALDHEDLTQVVTIGEVKRDAILEAIAQWRTAEDYGD